MKINKKNSFLSLFLLLCISASADPFASIPLDNEESGIAYVTEGDTLWYPIFFSVDKDNNIHIPDFYRGRIAIWSVSGGLIKSVATGYISPRMNVFIRSPEGKYIVIDSGKMYLLSEEGKLEWSYQFPFAFIPEAVYAIENYIYVLSHAESNGKSGRAAYAFQSDTDQPLGILGRETEESIIPVIIASETLVVSDNLANAQFLNDKEISEGSEDIIFVARDGSHNSWWYNKSNSGIYRNLIVTPVFKASAYVPRNYLWMDVSDSGDVFYSLKAEGSWKVIEIYGVETK